MKQRLPPLNAVRVFEAAGRHLSFSRAADELCVTNAAVSLQIKLLEEFLGKKLFHRQNNQLSLTEDGQDYLPRIRESLRALSKATDRLFSKEANTLRIGVSPSFGSKWLIPRLYRFLKQYPQVNVELATLGGQNHQQYDVCIDDSPASGQNLQIEWLTETDFFPVCSASMSVELQQAPDFQCKTLLHVRSAPPSAHYPTWRQWFGEAGIMHLEPEAGPVFSEAYMALQAAMAGQGLVLGQSILVDHDMAAGRLVRMLDTPVSLRMSYYLLYPQQSQGELAFELFRTWLLDEIRLPLYGSTVSAGGQNPVLPHA